MSCLPYYEATDGPKICWTLYSNTQYPYASSKPKLLSVALLLPAPSTHSHIAHMARMPAGALVVLIICPLVPCWKMDQCFGATLAHNELCLFDWSEALCS
ncbi:hypothetical protein PBY51_001771 [Eleginops maclovinus]|uniref:Uncharacterized protein n=1 Tax=Eleginops maclovinus TaxID=56733 RepID=A0AAN7WX25_ELEMC|nr:hypothetical protein PBY51_001771 [Eleginops maclovinus]